MSTALTERPRPQGQDERPTVGPKRRWRSLSLVAVLALGVVGTGASAASAGEPAVPFKASVTGTLTLGVGPSFTLAGSGNASHLGNVSYTASGTIIGVSGGVITATTLTETLTAANGDTLTILCLQGVTPVAGSPGVFLGTDSWTVIGGTGKFSGATGSGTGITNVDLNPGKLTFTKEFTGTITKGT